MADVLEPPPVGAAPAATRRRAVGYVIYLAGAALFAVNGTVAKVLLLEGVPAERLTQLRITASFLVLLAFVAATRPDALRLRRRELPLIAAYGIAGVTMTQYLYFLALTRLPVGVALVIEFTAPFMVVAWLRFVRGVAVPRSVWGALVVALVGLALVVRVWEGLTLDGLGVLAASGAALALAVFYLVGEKAVDRRDPVSLTMWAFGAGALFWAVVRPWWSFPWATLSGTAQPWGPDGPALALPALAAWMVLLGTVLPFILVVWSMRHITSGQASAIGMAEPVLATLVAWVVLAESLLPVQLAGGAVVLAGVLWAERARQTVVSPA